MVFKEQGRWINLIFKQHATTIWDTMTKIQMLQTQRQ